MKNFLTALPSPADLSRLTGNTEFPEYREANGHIHTPFSFSAFPDIESVFRLAKEENIVSLGINDFFVAEGYAVFHEQSVKNKVFPLFNIEFIGLMKEEQKDGTKINDPNNPGRIYFSGKALDFPFHLGVFERIKLRRVKKNSQEQIRQMIQKVNLLLSSVNAPFRLDYEEIRKHYAHELVRERHVAKALRIKVQEYYRHPDLQGKALRQLYGGKEPKSVPSNAAATENEIRSNLLKAGGAAFVEEDSSGFLALEEIIRMITDAGGVPCYPVLLDNAAGKFTEFEADADKLYNALSYYGIGCIELIPQRNDSDILKRFVEFFDEKGFIITFGTEHNSPDMIPLTPTAREGKSLDPYLKRTAWKGTCILAAHQYLRAKGMPGITGVDGRVIMEYLPKHALLGNQVIEYYLNHFTHEA